MAIHIFNHHDHISPRTILCTYGHTPKELKEHDTTRIMNRRHWHISIRTKSSGTYRLSTSPHDYTYEPDLVTLIAPGTTHYTYPYKNKPTNLRTWGVLFDGGQHFNLSRLTDNPHGHARIKDPTATLIQQISRCSEHAVRYGEKGFCQTQALLYQIIHTLTRIPISEDGIHTYTPEIPAISSFSETIKDYLDQNTHVPLTLPQIAEKFNISVSTLSHRFHRETATTPINYFLNARLNKAKQLVLIGEKLEAIASRTAFYNASHLSASFKKHLGLSPRAFLKQASTPQPKNSDQSTSHKPTLK